MKRMSKEKYYLGIAEAVSKRSTCLKKHYGCVIVKNDEIIATGYNGSPRGSHNCCDVGKCLRYEEGNHHANDGDYNTCQSVHAEQNAIISASRKDMIGSRLYLYGEEYDDWEFMAGWKRIENPTPCPICMRMIKNAGIREVIIGENQCML